MHASTKGNPPKLASAKSQHRRATSREKRTKGGVSEDEDQEELAPHFGVLERAAEEDGDGEADAYLKKPKIVMIAAHASKQTREADFREFL